MKWHHTLTHSLSFSDVTFFLLHFLSAFFFFISICETHETYTHTHTSEWRSQAIKMKIFILGFLFPSLSFIILKFMHGNVVTAWLTSSHISSFFSSSSPVLLKWMAHHFQMANGKASFLSNMPFHVSEKKRRRWEIPLRRKIEILFFSFPFHKERKKSIFLYFNVKILF